MKQAERLVGPVHLFDLASRQAQWLSARQATIAGNIANADTPGFKAQKVEPFVQVLDKTQLALARTVPGHVEIGGAARVRTASNDGQSWAVKHSGNSVSLEQELVEAGDVNRSFSLNTAIVKSFHRMLMASVKG